jgi:hypothetical protein
MAPHSSTKNTSSPIKTKQALNVQEREPAINNFKSTETDIKSINNLDIHSKIKISSSGNLK